MEDIPVKEMIKPTPELSFHKPSTNIPKTQLKPEMSKGKAKEDDLNQDKNRAPAQKKVQFKDIEIHKGHDKKERAPPAYHISTELQEKINIDKIYEKILDTQVTLNLCNMIGSSFELSQKLQSGTKSIKVPIASKVNTVAGLYKNHPLPEKEGYDKTEELECVNVELTSENEYMVNTWPVSIKEHSDDNDDESVTESEALEYENIIHKRIFKEQHAKEFQALSNLITSSQNQGYLAMVTAKIMGTVGGIEVMMLINTGSELNLVLYNLYERL